MLVPASVFPLLALLAAAVLFGGGGSPSPVGETVAICAALVVAGWAICMPSPDARPIAPQVIVLAALLPALALIQLLPLPAAISLSFPLREPLAQALAASGGAALWPITLDPASTLWSLVSLVPSVVALVLAVRLPRDATRPLLLAFVTLALFSAVVQGLQLAGGDAFQLHPRAIDAGPGGLFANQNSQGDFLLIGLCALAALFWSRRGTSPVSVQAAALIAAFLTLCIALTASRAAMLLLAVPAVLFAIVMARRGRGPRTLSAPRAIAFVAMALLAGALVLLALQAPVLAAAIDRFGLGAGARLTAIWPDSVALARAAFPWGTGLGTFPHVFPLVERLEVVDPTFANRAHSDWLEFVVEGGIAAFAVIAVGAVAVTRAVLSRLRAGLDCGDVFALASLAIVAGHSFVDYPIRSIALAVVSAVALGCILRGSGDYQDV